MKHQPFTKVLSDDWIIPVTGEAFTVANLMSEGMTISEYVELAVCVMAVEQMDRISKIGYIVPPNVVKAVDALNKKVKSQEKE